MTRLVYENFPEQLRYHVPGFDRVCAEHMADYDEILPHVLLGDLTRFLATLAEMNTLESRKTLSSAMELLERAAASSDPHLQELVVVSFLENLDSRATWFPMLRSLFGPRLELEWNRLQQT